MTEPHSDRLVAGRPKGRRDGRSPDSTPAAERKAEEAIRENPMGADPVATPDQGNVSATDRSVAPETGYDGTGASDRGPTSARLVEPARIEDFRRRWDTIKASFVDEPRAAVEHAERLTDEIVNELTAAIEARRRDLAERWREYGTDGTTDTERLRTVMHGYQNMLDLCLRP